MNIENNIVVPGRPALDNGLAVKPFRQIHLHSTGNVNATIDNEATYLSTHYGEAYYTHLVGQGRVMQVANTNGGAYDVGGDWNWEAYAAIEFSEKVANQAEFNKSYKLYIELARSLAKKAGITDFTLDTPATAGIKTHNYASKTGHGSDHTDPLAFLAKWGVSYDQFKHDIKYGVGEVSMNVSTSVSESEPSPSLTAIQQFKNAGNRFVNTKTFKVDKVAKVNGIWQMINYSLAGGKDADWTTNGIPLDIVDNLTRGMAPTRVGDVMKFNASYNHGTIDKYDPATNGVGIEFGQYGMVWFNADAFLKL